MSSARSAVAPAVVVAADYGPLATLLTEVLDGNGYRVIPCPTGHETLAVLHRHAERLIVLLSLRWPPLPSLAVLAHAAEEHRLHRHAYIVLTAHFDMLAQHEHALLRMLGVPVVPKPFELQHLLDVVAQSAARLQDAPS